MRSHNSKLLAIIAIALPLLNACAPPHRALVEERKVLTVRQQSEDIGGQLVRIVQSGDTLYSIAFASNTDVNQIAAWNNISDTSRLNVGQRIRLTKPIAYVNKERKSVAKKPRVPQEKAKQAVSKAKVLSPSQTASKTKSVVVASKSASQKNKKAAGTTTQPAPSSILSSKPTWIWPVEGKLIRRFSPSSSQQGVDIAAASGKRVVAAAAGEVVYVGNSLKGYGNLIIVKHNEMFLSAYAHNRAIFVKEGQKINNRQHIGSVGINNRRESALHFQIRRNGKPVNPLQYLPKNSS